MSQQLPLVISLFVREYGEAIPYLLVIIWSTSQLNSRLQYHATNLLYLVNETCEKPSIQKPGNNFIQLQQLISFAPAIDNYARFNIRHK